jgi:hypothetical protein
MVPKRQRNYRLVEASRSDASKERRRLAAIEKYRLSRVGVDPKKKGRPFAVSAEASAARKKWKDAAKQFRFHVRRIVRPGAFVDDCRLTMVSALAAAGLEAHEAWLESLDDASVPDLIPERQARSGRAATRRSRPTLCLAKRSLDYPWRPVLEAAQRPIACNADWLCASVEPWRGEQLGTCREPQRYMRVGKPSTR